MFGYVNICNSSISDEDKKLYRSYYCGLCKAIKEKSEVFRLWLNNDLTFLAVLLSSVVKEEPVILKDKKCIAHPFKKHNEVEYNKVLDYAADMNILLVYFKICDDAIDDKKLISILFKRIFQSKERKICKKYSALSNLIKEQLSLLNKLERENCSCIDKTADCFGKILEAIFSPDFIDDDTRKILGWVGYNIGRWIYILDAYSDIEADRKKGTYNPFLNVNNNEDISKTIYDSMTYTLSNIANACDLLKIYRNRTLIDNIIYSGLPAIQEGIFKKSEENNGSI